MIETKILLHLLHLPKPTLLMKGGTMSTPIKDHSTSPVAPEILEFLQFIVKHPELNTAQIRKENKMSYPEIAHCKRALIRHRFIKLIPQPGSRATSPKLIEITPAGNRFLHTHGIALLEAEIPSSLNPVQTILAQTSRVHYLRPEQEENLDALCQHSWTLDIEPPVEPTGWRTCQNCHGRKVFFSEQNVDPLCQPHFWSIDVAQGPANWGTCKKC